MKLDVLFTDYVCYRTYDSDVLAREGVGGTEGTIIRLAQALSLMGLKVGVMQHNREAMSMDGLVWLFTPAELDKLRPDNHVMIRGITNAHVYLNAKKYAFMHDAGNAKLISWREKAIEQDITFIAVSNWHKQNLAQFLQKIDETKNPKIKVIYNPVQDSIFIPKNIPVKYDNNKMVWAASPHKGLAEALQVFERIKEIIPSMELHVFNPGYFSSNVKYPKGVVTRGAIANQKQLWQEMSESLCLFYPTRFEETFGMIAAEANAVHCPVATNAVAALNETVSSQVQLSSPNDFAEVIRKIEHWQRGYRPKVWGQDRFRLSEVATQWAKMLRE